MPDFPHPSDQENPSELKKKAYEIYNDMEGFNFGDELSGKHVRIIDEIASNPEILLVFLEDFIKNTGINPATGSIYNSSEYVNFYIGPKSIFRLLIKSPKKFNSIFNKITEILGAAIDTADWIETRARVKRIFANEFRDCYEIAIKLETLPDTIPEKVQMVRYLSSAMVTFDMIT